ncbi:MAG TPA: M20/M25/M40 family metallo-hydrolase [Candidatus Dormibacteraeota bacterium]
MPPLVGSANLPSLQQWLAGHLTRWRDALEELVRCQSPSGDLAALGDCARRAEGLFETQTTGAVSELLEDGGVPSLLLRWKGAGGPSVLLLGHLDTVWDVNSFEPLFGLSQGRVVGPGVFDMKGGIVVALAAVAALQERPGRGGGLTVLLTGDEEVGSGRSRALIETEARAAAAVLVLEPPVGEAIKVARKGVGGYRISVKGRAAHAGLEPERGVNSLVGIAPLVAKIAGLGRPDLGTTVSPTRLRAGTRTNVIPAEAALEVDVRFATTAEASRVDLEMHQLRVDLPGAELEVSGGANRPPFERSSAARLFRLAEMTAVELGWPRLEGAVAGGGSDGNFTAALGVPTLDGLGIVGGNAHAEGEWADLNSLPRRAALLAGLVEKIWGGGWSD